MGSLQKTALEAFERDLQEAEKDFVAAGARVARAQDALNARRVEEGLDPLEFSQLPEEDESEDEEESEEEQEAKTGFGFKKRGKR